MSRYFFDINDGNLLRDEVGRDLEGGEIMRAEALQVAASLMQAEAGDAKETAFVLTVRNETGGECLRIRLVCQVEDFPAHSA
ncbi:hypothetical protein E8E01_23335 [Methylorubrum populi]|uniref:DUF6894 family protein n=1 Tax=Methylorubrum populi TaxID=223967 RepID=UPI00114F3219|nr:hypothetical protein E8E01_23335 [Methylorubrum populi]